MFFRKLIFLVNAILFLSLNITAISINANGVPDEELAKQVWKSCTINSPAIPPKTAEEMLILRGCLKSKLMGSKLITTVGSAPGALSQQTPPKTPCNLCLWECIMAHAVSSSSGAAPGTQTCGCVRKCF